MMLPFELLLVLFWSVEGVDISFNQFNNKTKRTVSPHSFSYGETKPVLVYRQTYVPPVFLNDDYTNLKSEYKDPVPLDLPEPIKLYRPQHSPEQTLYGFPKLVPNGQVLNRDNQLGFYKEQPLITTVDAKNFVPSESIVFPVQHRDSDIIVPQPHHTGYPNTNIRYKLVPVRNQGRENPNYELYNSQHLPLQRSPYVNQQTYRPQVNTVSLFPNQYSPQYQKVQSVPNVNYINRNYIPRKQNLNNLKYIPAPHSRSSVVHKKPLQINYTPIKPSFKKEESVAPKNEDDELVTKETRQIEDNSEKTPITEDDDNEQESTFHKQAFDFDETDHFDYKEDRTEEDYDQDNKRSSTTHIPLRKYPSKHSKSGKSNVKGYYKFQNSDYKQEHPKRRLNKSDAKTPKMIYKSINFAKETDDETSEDSIEGKHSENIPVTRKHTLFREKLYLSKNIDDLEKE